MLKIYFCETKEVFFYDIVYLSSVFTIFIFNVTVTININHNWSKKQQAGLVVRLLLGFHNLTTYISVHRQPQQRPNKYEFNYFVLSK